MKKLLFVFIGIIFFGCDSIKDLQNLGKCKICTTTVTYSGGYGTSGSSSVELCGDDIAKVDGKVITSKATSGNITITMTSRTTCK